MTLDHLVRSWPVTAGYLMFVLVAMACMWATLRAA